MFLNHIAFVTTLDQMRKLLELTGDRRLSTPSAWVRKDPQLQAQLLLCNYFDMAIAAFYNINFLFCKGKTSVPVHKNLV